MHVVEHHNLQELKALARRQRDARLLLRLQIIILARRGSTAPQIAAALSSSRRTVQDWVRRYNTQGIDGLRERRRGGNQRKLTDRQERELMAHLDAQADDPRGGLRRGHDVRRWITDQFGLPFSLPGAYKLLHRLGYSHLMPRPRHKRADAQAQEAFKKTPWRRSTPSPESTPIKK